MKQVETEDPMHILQNINRRCTDLLQLSDSVSLLPHKEH
jgi:hypothetical protein